MKAFTRWLLGVMCCCVGLSASAAFPNLKLPFLPGEPWFLTRGYGIETHIGKDGYALDFALGSCDATYGKPIVAVASGTVKSIKRVDWQTPDKSLGYGNTIVIDHGDGYSTRYAHLSSIDSSVAEEGERRFVNQGQKIGEAGGTGWVEGQSKCTYPVGVEAVHLHFTLYRNGEGMKPEPMSGYTGFARYQSYTSNNTLQSPASNLPAISCIYVANNQQFCWKSNSATSTLCGKAAAWILYDYNAQASYSKSASDCPAYCMAGNNYCKEVSGSLSVGGFGMTGSDMFNLKVNSFGVWDTAGVQLTPGASVLKQDQTVIVKVPVKAVNGNTSSHMQTGKDTVKVDLYVCQDTEEWVRLKRSYIPASDLASGTVQTESITYTVPQGVSEVSFKAKIDAEDEAYESNEGDNWSRIETFQVENYAWLIPIINMILED